MPILRSGAFTGFHLASKLRITNILPIQYKYIYQPREHLIKKFELPELFFKVPKKPNILLSDSNTVWGGIARKVISDIKVKYPGANLYYASATLDQSATEIKDIKKVFWGKLTNEKRSLTRKQAEEKGVSNEILIFPWEDLEEQWEEINTSQTQS